jgi:hypothetical protein
MENQVIELMERYKPDLYRHDFIPGYTYEGTSSLRDGFMENNYWRYYVGHYGAFAHIQAKYPNLILQMCTNGGTREDLDMMSRFHETYTNEGALGDITERMRTYTPDVFTGLPPLLPPYSGKTVALPPEILVFGVPPPQMVYGDTSLRVIFALGNTPWILCGPAGSVEKLSPELRERYLHYANIYKTFIRPLLPVCKVYHHEPVSSRGGVTSSPWFAMEFDAPDKTKGWATIVRNGGGSDTYLFKPRGLNPRKTYQVTYDSTGTIAVADGSNLMRHGLSLRLESVADSELLLFQTK